MASKKPKQSNKQPTDAQKLAKVENRFQQLVLNLVGDVGRIDMLFAIRELYQTEVKWSDEEMNADYGEHGYLPQEKANMKKIASVHRRIVKQCDKLLAEMQKAEELEMETMRL